MNISWLLFIINRVVAKVKVLELALARAIRLQFKNCTICKKNFEIARLYKLINKGQESGVIRSES